MRRKTWRTKRKEDIGVETRSGNETEWTLSRRIRCCLGCCFDRINASFIFKMLYVSQASPQFQKSSGLTFKSQPCNWSFLEVTSDFWGLVGREHCSLIPMSWFILTKSPLLECTSHFKWFFSLFHIFHQLSRRTKFRIIH